MRRIAYCSPVNPVASGISDYTEELLPYLGQYVDITLFVERGVVPSNEHLREHVEVRTLDELPARHRRQPFDAIVYHMGNSPAHGTILDLADRIPGVVVLHEWVLHHLKIWHAAERRRDINLYLAEMRRRYGADGERVARKMSRGQLQDAAFNYPLVEDVIERARGLIGHSRFVVDQARGVKPDLAAAVVPMGVPLPPLIDRDEARQQLGLPTTAPIWASFGHINPYKRMENALRAFKRFRIEHSDARYILVGSISPNYDLQNLIRRLDLDDAVLVTGYVSRSPFERYVAAADLCLNLRYPTAGETSASLLRLLGAGKPTLVSAVGAFAELPDDVCARVDVDASEGDLILAYARLLHDHPVIAAQLGSNARSFVARDHTLEGAARGYITFLSSLYGWGDVPATRNVLWEVSSSEFQVSSSEFQVPGTAQVDTPIQNPKSEIQNRFVSSVAAAAAELGVREDDTAPLNDIAATIDDLLGDGPRRS
jgi:glycosyltransferase involved in cell wall biosynthesis